MSLFSKKKEEVKTPACACNNACPGSETKEIPTECCGQTTEGICCVKVLGTGCKSCHALLEAAREAVRSMGLGVEVEYVTDLQLIMEYGVMSMPALVVNEQVLSVGKVLKAPDIERLLSALISRS